VEQEAVRGFRVLSGRDNMVFGFPDEEWGRAKAQAKGILIERAKVRDTIAYSDLAEGITVIDLKAHDVRLNRLLGEISAEEDAAGRGMVSVVVVRKDGDMKPGPGFFEYAGELGRDTSDIDACWISELSKVFSAWGAE
jgi:hypothetical protein